ncbi:MAG: hypothetical protein VYE77_11705 [Planctomycetota bacterium]|nr:hypothetical protein [Planctomycetota bacterium]
MGSRSHDVTGFMGRISVMVCAALLAACSVPEPIRDTSSIRALAALSGPETRWLPRTLPAAGESLELDEVEALIIGGQGWRLPDRRLDPEVARELRRFVGEGGRLLLLGYAGALVDELGLEEVGPDVVEPFRWGFDARTMQGRARLGFELVSGRAPDLVAGMQSASGLEHTFYLAGGEPCCEPLCLFAAQPPQRGEVLGEFVQERDGRSARLPAAVLTRWTLGRGGVLALGIEPDLYSDDPHTAANAEAFLTQALRWLGHDRLPQAVAWWGLPNAEPDPVAMESVRLWQREVPGASLLAHWGFVADVHEQPAPRRPEEITREVLLPQWRAGADVLALDLVEPERGLPVPWGEFDRLRRPDGYRVGSFAQNWHPGSIGNLAAEAHARGTLVQAILDPPPGGKLAAEQLATMRFVARELFCRRRLAERALDGVVLRSWFRDSRGLAAGLLQDYRPAGHLVAAGERMQLGGAVRALDAGDGQPAGLRAYGVASGFRTGFPGDLFPVGYLDCTTRRPLGVESSGPRPGGGSFGDWIAIQANDFVRDRIGRGGTMLWQSHSRETMGPDTEAYVQGVSVEPLVAAVAARCSTVGVDGWRGAQRALGEDVQEGFGNELPVPAATVLLQNNHLRLHGSGGALLLDRQGSANFRGSSGVVAREFMRTRLLGSRPTADALSGFASDMSMAGRRPEGGYEEVLRVSPEQDLPAVLAFGAAPRWPQRIDVSLGALRGSFELEVKMRAITGSGVVAVMLEDSVLAFLPFDDGRLDIARTLPVHMAVDGPRELRIEVVDGGSVAIDRLRLAWRGDLAAEAAVLEPAGSLAQVAETSTSTYHRERVELTTLADFPGLLLRAECEYSANNLQQERIFGLQLHRRLRGNGNPMELRGPFVLAAESWSVPDLAVVPLNLARYDHFELRDDGLVLVSRPESGAMISVGFVFLPRTNAPRDLSHLPQIFQAIDNPMALELGHRGRATLPSDLPVAWTRVLRISSAARTPFLVRENGWWTWRGTQSVDGGDQLLRVVQLPGDTVELVGGQALLAGTRPGPGSLHTVALRDVEPRAVTVRVLQASPLRQPSVLMASEFDEVFLDGQPWAHFDGRLVCLPNREGTYRVTTRRHGGARTPHVASTSALLDHCVYDPATRQLLLSARSPRGRSSTPWLTAVLMGPRPVAIDGGEVVEDHELLADPRAFGGLADRGVVVRFRPGIVRIDYAR